jgi:hypothetical protein
VNETEQDVLGADVVVTQQARFFLCQNHNLPRPVGEAFEHMTSITVARLTMRAATAAPSNIAWCPSY